MRTLVLCLSLFLATLGGASAQEFNWTRFYAGPFATFGFGQSVFSAPATTSSAVGTAGFGLGGVLGNTYDFNRFVVGGELDLQFGGVTGSSACPGATATCAATTEWLASLRAKAGIATDMGLIYGTVGPAVGGVTASITPSGGSASTTSQVKFGYSAGVGVEVPVSDTVTVGGEYFYTDLGRIEDPAKLGTTGATTSFHSLRATARFSF